MAFSQKVTASSLRPNWPAICAAPKRLHSRSGARVSLLVFGQLGDLYFGQSHGICGPLFIILVMLQQLTVGFDRFGEAHFGVAEFPLSLLLILIVPVRKSK